MPNARRTNDPLSIVLSARQRQSALCEDLESLADQLGASVDASSWSSVLDRLIHDLPHCHGDEEVLYDLLQADTNNSYLTLSAQRAEVDHRRFEDSVPEIIEQLEDILSDRVSTNKDAAGYALRCLFEGIRQHHAWEDVTLLGCWLRPLSPSEVAQFHAGIALNRRKHGQPFRLVPSSK